MIDTNRNEILDKIEQEIVVALYDSYENGFQSWKTKITFSEYMQAVQLALEYPELVDILSDDRKRRYSQGSE